MDLEPPAAEKLAAETGKNPMRLAPALFALCVFALILGLDVARDAFSHRITAAQPKRTPDIPECGALLPSHRPWSSRKRCIIVQAFEREREPETSNPPPPPLGAQGKEARSIPESPKGRERESGVTLARDKDASLSLSRKPVARIRVSEHTDLLEGIGTARISPIASDVSRHRKVGRTPPINAGGVFTFRPAQSTPVLFGVSSHG